jgi:hypothetical protein
MAWAFGRLIHGGAYSEVYSALLNYDFEYFGNGNVVWFSNKMQVRRRTYCTWYVQGRSDRGCVGGGV